MNKKNYHPRYSTRLFPNLKKNYIQFLHRNFPYGEALKSACPLHWQQPVEHFNPDFLHSRRVPQPIAVAKYRV